MYAMLLNLQVVLFFVHLVVKIFKKVLRCRLVIGRNVVYCITIIANILKKVADCIELRIVKPWLT